LRAAAILGVADCVTRYRFSNKFADFTAGFLAEFLEALGAQVPSRRFKDEIKPMAETSEVIYRLKPVSFRYKPEIEPTRLVGFGLIAEDVEKINRDLVVRDKERKPYNVRYDALNAMLLNEFLKEHCKVQELEANAVRQQKQIEALTAGLEKVNAQVELSGPAPQTVVGNQ
jgi:hypothetical protein